MQKVFEFLSGKKTIITGICMFLVGGVYAIRAQIPLLASVDEETWARVMEFAKIAGTGLVAIFLRLGVAKSD